MTRDQITAQESDPKEGNMKTFVGGKTLHPQRPSLCLGYCARVYSTWAYEWYWFKGFNKSACEVLVAPLTATRPAELPCTMCGQKNSVAQTTLALNAAFRSLQSTINQVKMHVWKITRTCYFEKAINCCPYRLQLIEFWNVPFHLIGFLNTPFHLNVFFLRDRFLGESDTIGYFPNALFFIFFVIMKYFTGSCVLPISCDWSTSVARYVPCILYFGLWVFGFTRCHAAIQLKTDLVHPVRNVLFCWCAWMIFEKLSDHLEAKCRVLL